MFDLWASCRVQQSGLQKIAVRAAVHRASYGLELGDLGFDPTIDQGSVMAAGTAGLSLAMPAAKDEMRLGFASASHGSSRSASLVLVMAWNCSMSA